MFLIFVRTTLTSFSAELRTIGMCDATDSELSIRLLATISAKADAENKHHPLLFLSPYQMPLLKSICHRKSDRRSRKNSSTDSLSSRSNSGKSSDEQMSPSGQRDIVRGDSTDYDEHTNSDNIQTHYGTNNRRLSNRKRQDSTASTSSNARHNQFLLANEMVAPNTIVSVTEDEDGVVRITYGKKRPRKYHSELNRIRNESVHRSKSFQEQGVKPQLRNSRFYVSRNQPGKKTALCSDFSLDTVSQNIEITVQNKDGVVKPADDDCGHQADIASSSGEEFDRFDCGYQENLNSVGSGGGGHIWTRIYRRLRKLTLAAWRRQKCKSEVGRDIW